MGKKFEENNNKLIQYIDGKHENLKQYIDEKIKEEHQKTVSDVATKLGEIVDIVGGQVEEVKQNQKYILRDLREARKELSARLDFHDYRLEKLEEKVG